MPVPPGESRGERFAARELREASDGSGFTLRAAGGLPVDVS